jgi:glycosyltransferase involved in cell wall biosynthesis
MSCLAEVCPSEIIVVDDCSTDNSLEKLLAYQDEIRIIVNAKNSGVAYSRNVGLGEALGKYVVFLDADDMLLPESMEKRFKYLEKHPEVDMVFGEAKKINADRKNYHWSWEKCIKKLDKLETYSRKMNAQTLMWRKEVFQKYGGYYEALRSKEDKELLFRLGVHPDSPFKKKIRVKKLKDFMAVYRRHPDAKHKKRIADKKWKKETDRIFDARIKQLKKEGITQENTRFPRWI